MEFKELIKKILQKTDDFLWIVSKTAIIIIIVGIILALFVEFALPYEVGKYKFFKDYYEQTKR